MIHFQFPPTVTPSSRVTAHIEHCAERLGRDTLSIEFRHKSWWDGAERTASTLALLRDIGAVHTIVDGPQGADNSVPAVWEATHPDYVLLRLSGRNAETYNADVPTAADRFNYEYSDDELSSLAAEMVRLAFKVKNAHAIFNNCDEDKGVRNAQTFIQMLSG